MSFLQKQNRESSDMKQHDSKQYGLRHALKLDVMWLKWQRASGRIKRQYQIEYEVSEKQWRQK